MTFTSNAWLTIQGLFESILNHPFLRGLSDGSLPMETFQRYLVQDCHYLIGFSQALSLAAARAEDTTDMALHRRASAEAMEVERALHLRFFRRFGISGDLVRCTPPNPVCSAYIDYLLALAYHHPYPLLVAGLLPCNLVYWEVGVVLTRDAGHENRFLDWIRTYSNDPFGVLVRSYIDLVDRTAERQTPTMRDRMLNAFVKGVRLEYLFWDAAYKAEDWPPI